MSGPVSILEDVPAEARKEPLVALRWMLEVVPCFKGPIPGEWTDAVVTKLRKAHVPDAVIGEALAMAPRWKYEFTLTGLPLTVSPPQINEQVITTPQTQMRA